MARSGLTADEVEALDTDDVSIPILEEGVYIGTNDTVWKRMLAAVIASNLRCEVMISSPKKNLRMKTMVFIGHEEDVQVASECYKLTIKVAQRCFRRYSKWSSDRDLPIDTKSQKVRNSYYVGFVEGLNEAYSYQVEENSELAIALQLPSDVRAFVDAKNLDAAPNRKVGFGDLFIRNHGYQDGYSYGTGHTLD